METEPSTLAEHIEAALDRGLAAPDNSALDGSGAATAAACLAEALTRAKTED